MRAAWSGLAEGATLKLVGTHDIPISKDDVSFEPRTRLPGGLHLLGFNTGQITARKTIR